MKNKLKLKLTLTQHLNQSDPIAWNEQGVITHQQFISDVMRFASELPDKQYAINLCEERYRFMVAFAAVIVKEQTNLLPQSRVTDNILAVAADYPSHYIISEKSIDGLDIDQIEIGAVIRTGSVKRKQFDDNDNLEIPEIEAAHIAAIAFTSGSTGKPQANSKSWQALVTGAAMAADRFNLLTKKVSIVATVPPQHMYGLETSILYSLQNGCPVYSGRPFYPHDIKRAIASSDRLAMLITTPVHLRACYSENDILWENLDCVISATAPLRKELAQQVSAKMNAKVMEIFGCTEAGAIASREPLSSDVWSLYKGASLENKDSKPVINVVDIVSGIELSDSIKIIDETHFRLLGRDTDMVNIAGKRGSIADLTLKLQSIDAVDDAIIFLPESNHEVNRLAAFAVTSKYTRQELLTILSEKIDSVFLPRPLYVVKELPYNETGKLTLKSLELLLQQLRQKKNG